MNEPDHWLVMRLSALGDVVLTTGVLDYLHKKYGWRFTFLTYAPWASVLEGHPAIDRVIGITKDEVRSGNIRPFFKKLVEEHEGCGFLDLHGTLRSRRLAFMWKGTVRRYPKFSLQRRLYLASGGKLGSQKLLKYNVPQRYALATEPQAPLRQELLPHIYLSAEEREYGQKLKADIAGKKPLVALHPFSTHPNKAWLDGHWCKLAEGLVAKGVHVCVVGVGKSPICAMDGVTDLTGKTTLRETCAVLSESTMLVTGDSGPMHLAGGVGTPVVALFGPTHKAWGFYPEGALDVVLESKESCRPCSLHGKKLCDKDHVCMRSLTPELVLQRIQILLNQK